MRVSLRQAIVAIVAVVVVLAAGCSGQVTITSPPASPDQSHTCLRSDEGHVASADTAPSEGCWQIPGLR
jgi:hypothetical protein